MIYVNDKGYITTTKTLSEKEKENDYLVVDLSKPINRQSLEDHLNWNISFDVQKEKDVVFVFTQQSERTGYPISRLVAWKRYNEKLYRLKVEMHPYVKDIMMNSLVCLSGRYRDDPTATHPVEMKKIGYNKYLIYFR